MICTWLTSPALLLIGCSETMMTWTRLVPRGSDEHHLIGTLTDLALCDVSNGMFILLNNAPASPKVTDAALKDQFVRNNDRLLKLLAKRKDARVWELGFQMLSTGVTCVRLDLLPMLFFYF
jgi:hypothetical protein